LRIKKISHRDEVKKAIQSVDRTSLAVGWGKEQKYPDGTPVATVAITQEFGSPSKNIPPRSFVRKAANDEGENWKKQYSGGIKKVLNGDIRINQVISGIALLVEGDIKKAISKVVSPPLNPKTIKARLIGKKVGNKNTSVKPLVDTGYMMASVTHEEITK